MKRTAPLVLALLALAAPAPAVAQQAPTLGAPEPSETAPRVTTSGTDDGLEAWQEVLIFGAGVVLLLGIAWAIIGDARQRAPDERRGHMPEMADGPRGTHARRSKAKARAKGREARRQRRKNR